MNDSQDKAERDRRLLAMMDELPAGAGPAAPTGEPLHDFAALLAGAAPQPDPTFRQKLDARHTTAVRERAGRPTPRPRPAGEPGPALRGNAGWSKLFRPAAGAMRGLAGGALIILLIAGLGALLEARRGGGFGGGPTPTPRPTATALPTPGPDTPLNMDWTVILEPQAAGSTRAAALAWAPGGRQFAAITHEGIITVWDMVAHRRQTITSTLDGGPAYLAWSAGGSGLAACCYRAAPSTAHIILWDPATGQQQGSLDSGADSVTALAWSPDGQILAWSDGWSIQRWSNLSGSLLPKPAATWPAPLTTPRPATDTIRQLAWSPDGRSVATAQGATIKVWDVTGGTELARLDNKGAIWSLAWSPVGDMLAALPAVQTGPDQYQTQEVVIWDPATGGQRRTLALPDNATNLSWLGDTGVLAVGGNPVRLYSAITGVQLRILDRAGQVAGGPDGRTLLVGGPETVTLWGAPTAPPLSPPATEAPAPSTEAAVTATPLPTTGPPIIPMTPPGAPATAPSGVATEPPFIEAVPSTADIATPVAVPTGQPGP
jgi:hypothetical protein